MVSEATQAVITHYERRHEFRGGLFGSQPYANYGYWTRPGLTLEQASEALTDLVAAAAGLGEGDKVLDVGCGYGAGAVKFVQRYSAAAVTGIDVTPVRIASGQDYIAEHGVADRVTLEQGDATAMTFGDASFHKLVSVECAFHFDTRADFLAEAARVLAPGGTLALTDIIPRRGVQPSDYLTGEITTQSQVCLDMPANAYDADTYAQHLVEAGFEAVRIESLIEWTRIPFANALARLAEEGEGERAQQLGNMAKRIRKLIELGEDYVLVTARRS